MNIIYNRCLFELSI